MASITGNATVVNSSGDYEIIVYPCGGGGAIAVERFTAATSGNISRTITSSSLDLNLGSIYVQIREYGNHLIYGQSACFNHNCSVGSSISSVTGSSTC